MAQLAQKDMAAILARLKTAITESGLSLRALSQASERLDPPERLHHSNLSEILRGIEGRDLYLQTFLAVCMLISRDPASIMFDEESAALMRSMARLSHAGRMTLLRQCLELLEAENASAALRTRLRQQIG
jgi:hypothetical protein